jgi:hypothetical protein
MNLITVNEAVESQQKDCRQIPPVVKHGEKNDILRASLKLDPWYRGLIQLSLRKNQRARVDPEYAAMTAAVGNGTAPTVRLPDCPLPLTPLPLIQAVPDLDDLIAHAYPALQDPYASVTNAILAGTNERIDFINDLILERLPGELQHLFGADTCEDDEGKTLDVPTETLATCTDVGVPPQDLQLKHDCLAIVIRNLNFGARLCNSTKVIVREILPSRRLIRVEVKLLIKEW